ncbi:hypothetical protein GcM3_111020 [Golovinomyces cichoracearum]|uniref:Uncharacterized protein n=1 Tax=Golovinomyces cichoracearum TaxID=62708 RepID=A0A420I909_9PEZI|nr:hypothetical protein GcM3_111020 [Golovinomyces cichoracearum]
MKKSQSALQAKSKYMTEVFSQTREQSAFQMSSVSNQSSSSSMSYQDLLKEFNISEENMLEDLEQMSSAEQETWA